MKETYNQYKENFKYFITNKFFIIMVIVIAIFCYGFAITNFSVGVDDLVQDRYITGTFLLSQGRWGNVLASRLFDITSFIPFWPELLSAILFVFIAVLLCSFIKKEIGNVVDKTIYYIIFSGIFLSYPIIHQISLYLFANVIFALSTIGMIIVVLMLYENVFNIKNKKLNIFLILILPFFISMYEANCQTFLVIMFATAFINIIKTGKVDKKIFIFIFNCIFVLFAGIVLNAVINVLIKKVLEVNGLLTPDFSARSTPWISKDIVTCFSYFKNNVISVLWKDILNIQYIALFFVITMITMIISIVKSIKNKNILFILINIAIFLSNFVIIVIQARVLYRANTSWAITLAFMVLYILVYFKKYDIWSKVGITLAGFIILYNSKTMTLNFYNDYLRYEREKNIAYDIANTIIRSCDNADKPLIYIGYNGKDLQGNAINVDNGWSIISWGTWAFAERGVEVTRFINSLGYNFTAASNELYETGYKEFLEVADNYNKDFIIEFDDYIIVKVILEPR